MQMSCCLKNKKEHPSVARELVKLGWEGIARHLPATTLIEINGSVEDCDHVAIEATAFVPYQSTCTTVARRPAVVKS